MKPPTDSQWEAVRRTDPHLLVTAGAGTGKTHTVVWKILYLLGVEVRGQRIAEPLALEDIAAITYTKQAAKELKEDLRAALRAVGRRAQAREVDTARVGTIHSFCAELLRDYALRAGRAPAQQVLEEGVALEWTAEAAREALVDALEDGSLPGIDAVLAAHRTADVDGWVIDLMRRTDLVRRLRADPTVGGAERVLLELAARAGEVYDARLARAGAIDFDRMVLWTRDLLRADATLRRALQRRLRVLIVDEFQDVDPAQQEIAYLLGEPESRRTDTPRLVLVGDPKQSIYRFRHADVTVWSAVQSDFQQDGLGEVVPLTDNFRSVPGILGFVEATVAAALDSPLDNEALLPYEVPFLPVIAVRPTKAAHAVELIVTPAGPNGKARSAADARALEAAAIARRAVALHREGRAWKDMALLVATWHAADVFRSALEAGGVPVYALRDEGFYETRAVLDLVLALEVARDPGDDRALLGLLRSPFVGLRDESLAEIAFQTRRPFARHLADVVLTDTGDAERLARAILRIEAWATLRDRIPVPALLDRILDDTGYVAHLALSGERGAQAIANVRQFGQLAREAGGVSVGDLLRVVKERRERKDRVAEARLVGPSDDVLTITSIHVSKGLDWPVVFWADLGGQGRPFSEKLLVTRDAIRLGEANTSSGEQPAEFREVRTRCIAEEEAERKRLWYVAATRAEDLLVVSGIPQGVVPAKCAAAAMIAAGLPGLAGAADGDTVTYTARDGVAYETVVHVAHETGGDVGGDELRAARADATADYEDVTTGDAAGLDLPPAAVRVPVGPPRHSATAFLAHARCPRRYYLRYIAGLQEPEIPFMKQQMLTAVTRGQIVHDVLERWQEEAELDALLEDAIGRWDEDAPPPDSTAGMSYRGELHAEVERVLGHSAYGERIARPDARRELGFLYLYAPGVTAQGSIDLATTDATSGALELVDVKTSQCEASVARRKAAEYAPQRDVYVAAASAITGRPVARFGFLFSKPGVNIEEEIDAAAAADMYARIGDRAALATGADHPLTDDPAQCKWCGFQRAGLCPGVPETAPSRPQS